MDITKIIQELRGMQLEGLREWRGKIALNRMTRQEANRRYTALNRAMQILADVDAKKGVQAALFPKNHSAE